MKTPKQSRLTIALIALCCVLLASIGWIWFDNTVDRSGWEYKDNTVYYRDFHGRRVTGWQEIEGKTYFFDSEKHPITGWHQRKGSRWHFGDDGVMSEGWEELDGNRYFFGKDGKALTGFQEVGEKGYFFSPSGIMQTGWQNAGGTRRYFLQNGAMATGWLEIEGNRYFFLEDGTRAFGWYEIGGELYYFLNDGTPITGTAILPEGNYYFLDSGVMHTGWIDRDGGRYYYDANGLMVTGWQEISDRRFYFNADGSMYTGWLRQGEYRYYLQEDGSAAVGPVTVEGKQQYFTPKGIHVVLVNRNHPIPKDYVWDLVTYVDWYQVERVALEPLTRMLNDCAAAGIECTFNSSYRSHEQQVEILELRTEEYRKRLNMSFELARAEALKTVAVPGTSEHELGLSMDLVGVEANAWLAEHCWEYGFILRYPEGKEEITGIDNEPWHFRYVGTKVSMDMKDSGLCLEEYLGAA